MAAKEKKSWTLFQVLRELEKINQTLVLCFEEQNSILKNLSRVDPASHAQLLERIEGIHQSQNKNPEKKLKETWFDVEETMKMLNISRRTLQNYRDQGVLSFSQIGSKIYFRAADLDDHLDRHYAKAFKTKR